MDRHLVIKVKYGDTLKRFGASIHGKAMDHDMTTLKAKIISLFKFRPDADFVLTYTDEDGDIVTLDNDDELRDAAVIQSLNPLRINVSMKSHAEGISEMNFEPAGATPAGSADIQSHRQISLGGLLFSFLHDVPSKVSEDLSKATSSSPAIADFVELLSKLAISKTKHPSNDTPGKSQGPTSVSLTTDLGTDVPKAAHDPPVPSLLHCPNSAYPVVKFINKQHEVGNMENVIEAKVPTSVDLNADIPMNPIASECPLVTDVLSSIWTTDTTALQREPSQVHNNEKSGTASSVPPADQKMEHNLFSFAKPQTSCSPSCGVPIDFVHVGSSELPACPNPSELQVNLNTTLSGSTVSPSHDLPPSWFNPTVHPFRRATGYHDSTFQTFHKGVQCDGCGMHPIMGPRFKSNVKEDYDLCGICFSQMGNEADYTRIDHYSRIDHTPYHLPRLSKDFYNSHSKCRRSSKANHGCGTRPFRAKLDSRFIQDVTVLDGTAMSASTTFTKIWRMRNNGTIAWPYGTQLVWIGGDQLGNQLSVELEIPVKGFSVDEEINVSVDFTAPSRPGRYISYWKMAAPSGQKFGQRIWVLIQVDNSLPYSSASSSHSNINLNLPPVTISKSAIRMVDMNAEPVYSTDTWTSFSSSHVEEEVVKPSVVKIPDQKTEAAEVDGLLGVSADPALPVTAVPTPLSYIHEGFEIDMGLSSRPGAGENVVELTLLKELEEMGFKQINLNKEILRLNEYDLEQSVDDLCGFSEWDPLLNELYEMGFYDKEKNKKLLIKYGGSIKCVVLDLIAAEKGE